jgi:hypothetical protein
LAGGLRRAVSTFALEFWMPADGAAGCLAETVLSIYGNPAEEGFGWL